MNKEYDCYFKTLKRRLAGIQTSAGAPLGELRRAVEVAAAYRRALPLPGVTVTQIAYFIAEEDNRLFGGDPAIASFHALERVRYQ